MHLSNGWWCQNTFTLRNNRNFARRKELGTISTLSYGHLTCAEKDLTIVCDNPTFFFREELCVTRRGSHLSCRWQRESVRRRSFNGGDDGEAPSECTERTSYSQHSTLLPTHIIRVSHSCRISLSKRPTTFTSAKRKYRRGQKSDRSKRFRFLSLCCRASNNFYTSLELFLNLSRQLHVQFV